MVLLPLNFKGVFDTDFPDHWTRLIFTDWHRFFPDIHHFIFMTQSLHANTVLVLNRNWQAVHTTSPVEIFGAMVNGQVLGLAIDGPDWMVPVSWEDWQGLELRPGDRSIGTINGRLRIPTVVVLKDFDRVPRKRLSFGLAGLWERDGGRCQYSGRKLRREEANIDHVIPASRGGPSTWENCVLSDREINNRKADRTPQEAGLKLLKQPVTPPVRLVSHFIQNKHQIDDWEVFLPAS